MLRKAGVFLFYYSLPPVLGSHENGGSASAPPNKPQSNQQFYEYYNLFNNGEQEYEYYTASTTVTTPTGDFGRDDNQNSFGFSDMLDFGGLNIDGILNAQKEKKQEELVFRKDQWANGSLPNHLPTSTTPNPNIKSNIFSLISTKLTNIIKPISYDPEKDKPLPPIRDYLYKYGCYCFPEMFEGTGPRFSYSGDPLDEFDSLCRDLWRSQKCLRWDFEDVDKSCDTTSDYSWYRDVSIGEEETVDDLDKRKTLEYQRQQLKCGEVDDNNQMSSPRPSTGTSGGNQCLKDNCNLELQFITKVMELINAGVKLNDDLHMFDSTYKTKCFHPGMRMGAQKVNYNQCCGEGFTRRPYSEEYFSCEEGELVRNRQ